MHCSKVKPLGVQAGPLHCCVENVISVQEYISSCCPSNNEMLVDGNSKHERGWHRECVCVSENPVVPGNQTCPWPRCLLLETCPVSRQQPTSRLLLSFPYFYLLFLCSSFLILHFFPFLSHTYLSGILQPAVHPFLSPSTVLDLLSSCFVSAFFASKAKPTHVTTERCQSLAYLHTHTMLSHLEWRATWQCLLIRAPDTKPLKGHISAINIPQ